MKKNFLVLAFSFAFAATASAQTLFTYGSYAVDAKEFLRAYSKNNTQPVTDKAKSISEYLDLYIKSRLKIREAYDRRYDTLPQLLAEVANLRTQVAENYMTDPAIMNRLVQEAFTRSQKDINVAHIFISFRKTDGFFDTAAAQKKRDEIISRLQKGEDFLKVAETSSDDLTAKTNKGMIGYITVFTLPYEFETAIYSTPVNKYSAAVASKAGYHIFKNLGERKAVGKIKAQQILLAIPPNADEATRKEIAARADSLYKRILAGDNFNRLANTFSNDYVTAVNNGIMPDIGVGQYDPAFETALWALAKDNAVSKPFLTPHGWHIVKRISRKPVVTDANDKENMQDLQQRIMTDGRWKISRDFIYKKVKDKAGFTQYPYDKAAMWAMSDSVLDLKPMTDIGRTIIATTPIYKIGDSVYNATAWVNYANIYRYKQDGTGAKPHDQVMDEWIKFSLLSYYKDHLEDFNEDFKNQMAEFTDGNLFFEIMQQEVWNKAQTDTAALKALYQQNQKSYTWKQSADAVLFFCSDMNAAQAFYDKLKAGPAAWKTEITAFEEKIIADSSRYEWGQIPNLNKMAPRPGMLTTPVVNTNDNTASFAWIVNVYPEPTQRSFTEAKGLVINDYQLVLEKKWDEALRKKYPVTINQKVLEAISR
ncbi:MAG: peptidyl-prolyl cis-trans isomerase [Chitinophagaceae bacterium]|nr:peptidyl-prolyl cis-trans isomerase [Chitinophagaceae bacterium]